MKLFFFNFLLMYLYLIRYLSNDIKKLIENKADHFLNS